MALNPRLTPIFSSTQDYVEVADIINDILITKNGTFCLIVQTTSVNFDLLSEEEQDMKIQAYASLVNSLDFQMQVVIETRKVNISAYAEYIDKLDTPDLTPGLKRQFTIYKKFVRNLITKKEILDKKFFIVIPFRTGAFFGPTTSLEQKTRHLDQAVNYLYPKKYHVIKLLKNMGLDGEQLTNRDLVKYFYQVHNPDTPLKIEGVEVKL